MIKHSHYLDFFPYPNFRTSQEQIIESIELSPGALENRIRSVCVNCGAITDPKSRFCTNCGKLIL